MVLKSIVDVIKHASFLICTAFHARGIWENQLLTRNMWKYKSSTFYIPNYIGLQNKEKKISSVMFNRFLLTIV